jgi:hypothetical protein
LATRVSSGPGPAAALLNDEYADRNSVFASSISLRDDTPSIEQHHDDSSLNEQPFKDGAHFDQEFLGQPLSLLPQKFLADPDNIGYSDMLLQIYGPDAGQLLA